MPQTQKAPSDQETRGVVPKPTDSCLAMSHSPEKALTTDTTTISKSQKHQLLKNWMENGNEWRHGNALFIQPPSHFDNDREMRSL